MAEESASLVRPLKNRERLESRRTATCFLAGRGVVANAPALGAGDREFESPRPDEEIF